MSEPLIYDIKTAHTWDISGGKPPEGYGDNFWHKHQQTVRINGVLYSRESSSGGKPPDPPTSHFRAVEDADIAVVCGKCFCNAFTLSYGSYEIDATCVQCGHEDEVYSG